MIIIGSILHNIVSRVQPIQTEKHKNSNNKITHDELSKNIVE